MFKKLLIGLLAASAQIAHANINLDIRPDTQVATIGSTVNFDLYAVSDNMQNQSIGAMDVILVWDPTKLRLLGFTNSGNTYNWLQSGFLYPGGLNQTFDDGDAIWTAFAQPGSPAFATPQGLRVTRFRFEALDTTPSTMLAIPRDRAGFMTVVYDGVMPNTDVTGTLDSGAEAVIYTDTYPIATLTINRGIVISGGLPEIQQSDNTYMVVRPGIVFSTSQSPIELTAEAILPTDNGTELRFTLESAMNQGNLQQQLEMFNFTTNMYQVVDTRVLPTSDTTVNIIVNVGVGNYIEQGTGRVRARMNYRQSGPIFSYPWLLRLDLVQWRLRT